MAFGSAAWRCVLLTLHAVVNERGSKNEPGRQAPEILQSQDSELPQRLGDWRNHLFQAGSKAPKPPNAFLFNPTERV